MQPQHRSYLISTESTIRTHLAEIRRLITTGASPGGSQGKPLPVEQCDQLLTALDRLESSLTEVIRNLVPDSEDARSKSLDGGNTRMWASLLLQTVAELIRELSPEVIAGRYGAITPVVETSLTQAVTRLLGETESALELLRC